MICAHVVMKKIEAVRQNFPQAKKKKKKLSLIAVKMSQNNLLTIEWNYDDLSRWFVS